MHLHTTILTQQPHKQNRGPTKTIQKKESIQRHREISSAQSIHIQSGRQAKSKFTQSILTIQAQFNTGKQRPCRQFVQYLVSDVPRVPLLVNFSWLTYRFVLAGGACLYASATHYLLEEVPHGCTVQVHHQEDYTRYYCCRL